MVSSRVGGASKLVRSNLPPMDVLVQSIVPTKLLVVRPVFALTSSSRLIIVALSCNS